MSKDTAAAYRAKDEAERADKAENEKLNAKLLEQADAKRAEAERASAKKDDEIRKAHGERDEARDELLVATMRPQLDNRVSRTADHVLTAILVKAKGRNAKPELTAHKSEIAALQQMFRNGENRQDIFKFYNRLLPKLDEQTQAEMEEKVGKPLMGE